MPATCWRYSTSSRSPQANRSTNAAQSAAPLSDRATAVHLVQRSEGALGLVCPVRRSITPPGVFSKNGSASSSSTPTATMWAASPKAALIPPALRCCCTNLRYARAAACCRLASPAAISSASARASTAACTSFRASINCRSVRLWNRRCTAASLWANLCLSQHSQPVPLE